ncbi:ATP-grasp domain-containing protein [Methylomonas rivi]|uniref:ATP-grasp domain-containing protein n=1 Tax=Methylomonas rivi TaxID=2952226 RepID=A0ABT1U3Y7_9GAMM|nr:ATP-grasp domain-containing protein [Methylomonas sp. WSC-6]MCQ8128550.1 ATP-grasp domain-containing protein [Methylomonas sp. WSC-6]
MKFSEPARMSNLKLPSKLLVIARSARMLAQLAVDAGFQAVAVDCYADLDTVALAAETVKVDNLAAAIIQPVIEALASRHGLTHMVYGSGFEHYAESLDYLESRLILLGNTAALFRRFQDKPAFFQHLKQLSIKHPETVFSAPAEGGDWLLKPMRGEGGVGIARFADGQTVDARRFYWQRYLVGEAFSVLFAAGLGQVRVLGFNRQWAVGNDKRRYLFAGVSNHADVSPRNRALLAEWLEKLVGLYPLQGLGSLDFIVHDGECHVLEINARIPASAQLYGTSVFNKHCLACLGVIDDADWVRPAGFQIIFARNELLVPVGLSWPEWAVDRPAGGVFIGKGAPVCSIIAAGNDAAQVETRLRHRQIIIDNFINTGHLSHAIPS